MMIQPSLISATPRPGYGFMCSKCKHSVRDSSTNGIPSCLVFGRLVWYENGKEFCDKYEYFRDIVEVVKEGK